MERRHDTTKVAACCTVCATIASEEDRMSLYSLKKAQSGHVGNENRKLIERNESGATLIYIQRG